MTAVLSEIAIERLGPSDPNVGRDLEIVDALARQEFRASAFVSREEIARPWSRIWVVRYYRDVVGFSLAWQVVDELHLLEISVASEFRRRGLGTALMEEFIRFAKNASVRKAFLEVRSSNRAAIELYKKMEFEAISVRHAYYPDGEDALEMMRLFAPAT